MDSTPSASKTYFNDIKAQPVIVKSRSGLDNSPVKDHTETTPQTDEDNILIAKK